MRTQLLTLLGMIMLGGAFLPPSVSAVVYMEIIEVKSSDLKHSAPKRGLLGQKQEINEAPPLLLSEIWGRTPEGKRRMKRGPRTNPENETNRILFFKAPTVLAQASAENTELVVDVSKQRIYLLVNGAIGLETQVSTARADKSTPHGSFTMTERVRNGKISNIYSVAMPYWMRLGESPYGVHAGYLPGYAASAGCIRLPMQAAEVIYNLTAKGTTVRILDSWTPTPPSAEAMVESTIATSDEKKKKFGIPVLLNKKKKRQEGSQVPTDDLGETFIRIRT